MRIVCDSCGAKYSIADEKIAGKLFKVRCKKCSNMIMVDGTALGFNSPADSDDGGAWYVVIDGAQTGPMSSEEVLGQVSTGAIDGESFAWREGLDDWQRLADIAEFSAHFVAPSSAGADPFEEESTRVVGSSESFLSSAGFVQPGSTVSGDSSLPDVRSVAAAAPGVSTARPTGSGLLSHGGGGSPASTSQDFFSSANSPEAAAPGGEPQTGERSETSVLFSLSDLTSSKKKQTKDDLPRTEGSGLIDIRVLASAQAPSPSTAPVLGDGPPAGSTIPVAPLMALPPRRSSPALVAMIVVGVVLILGLGAALAVLLLRDDTPPFAPTVAEAPAPAAVAPASELQAGGAPVAAPGDEPADQDEVAAAPTEPTEAGGEAGDEDGEAGDDSDGEEAVAAASGSEEAATGDAPSRRSDREPSRSRGSAETPTPTPSSRTTVASVDAPTERAPTPAPATRSDRTAEPAAERSPDAVNQALDALRRRQDGEAPAAQPTPAREAAAAPSAPQTLSRDDVSETIRRYRSRIGRCTDLGPSGTYRVRFVIQPSGSVTSVEPEEASDISQCITNVVSDMTFPRFQGSAIPVTFPFRL